MSTTLSGVAPASAVAVPANSSPQTDVIDTFQGLFDAQNALDNGTQPETDERPDLDNKGQEGETEGEQVEPAKGAKGKKAEGEPEGEEAEPAKEPEEKHYESLEHYLKDTGVEPESFMTLPVKVVVDGNQQDVPLGELVKGYQLASASYARMNDAAQERQKIQTETTQVRQALGIQIKQANELLTLSQNQLVQDFNGIDWNALRTSDPGNYAALHQDFQNRQIAINQAKEKVVAAERANAQAAEQARQQAVDVERQRLIQARPEWRDPAKSQAAYRSMTETARKLGFSDAELNSITDHRQLLILDMAARFAQLQAKTPGTLKRVRAAPKMATPGTRQVKDPKVSSLKSASDAWARSGYRSDDAAAALLEQLG